MPSPPRWLGPALAAGAFAGLVWLEHRRPLRRRVEPAARHTARNLAVAGLSALAIRALEKPVVEPLARAVERRRWGLLPALALPRAAERLLALVLLDYTLYWWHVGTHRLPFLWAFHRVHHADRDLDASTALRFHFAEMALSVPYRAAQVLLIGVRPADLALWQRLTLAEILFHHSNLRLPPAWEGRVGRLLVTPRMHGIHHSRRPAEMDSNWSSGLTVWDWLHGTLRLDVPQEDIVVGVAGCGARDVTLPRLLVLPLRGG
ncbi:sterol desaturase family protein [Azospirillum sp. ST 5-10]|uniref:sterol desaturase family protein n=1 Tax=unclassified Azospirillum TaxID=2630922 RepID=UPI003F4A5CB9